VDVVHDHDPLADFHAVEEDVPIGHHVLALESGEFGHVGCDPVATMTTSGDSASTVSTVASTRSRQSTASLSTWRGQEAEDAGELGARGPAGGDQDLSPDLRLALEDDHPVAPQRGHPRRLEAGHAGADHEHAPGHRGRTGSPISASRPVPGFWMQVTGLP
jgi:hypothetical protein